MNIVKELQKNQTILVLVPNEKFNKVETEFAKQLASKSVCYITTNKTYGALVDTFKKNKVNLSNVYFIDAITRSIKNAGKNDETCYYVSSPGALTELSLVISKFLSKDFDYLVFDSLTNLSIYRESRAVQRFLLNLINKIKERDTKAVILSLDVRDQEDTLKQSSTFVDAVIDLGKRR